MSSRIHAADPANVGEKIILALRRYRTVPIDFLSRITGEPQATLEVYLDPLEEKRIIKREGEKVTLTEDM